MIQTVYPPKNIASTYHKNYQIFLAGSIEMGKATDWQQKVIEYFDARLTVAGREDIVLYNPRRKDWDSSWKQGIEEPQFFQQVTWELEALERASHIIMYFEPGTISPISLLELGLYAGQGKLLVVCPEGYQRKGNVDIVCQRYGINQFESLTEACELLAGMIEGSNE